ncbi:transcription factor atoh8 [Mugil cephalus]|uniref:transcription factor atoh8 n=1 Tax=Mugil cephalus TaxID=48193 RepID=UPI001FB59960|nr:transcription factor atoh8 [Mugil cephalus]
MKSPLPLSDTWNASINKDAVLISRPDTNKKFKRKSRVPKRLFTGPEPERMKTYPSDVDSVDDLTEAGDASALAPLHRQLMVSQEPIAGTAGIHPGQPEDNMSPAQSGAIDMRIGINVPAIASKVSPAFPFFSPEISQWPTSISQPLSTKLKLGVHSAFPLLTSTNNNSSSSSSGSSQSPGQLAFSLKPSSLQSGQAAALALPRATNSTQCQEHMASQDPPPKDSPTKQIGMSADGPGRLPEVKAIQQTRRLLANARERSRVHTISAAFEALRKQVPCYSYGQKLSKLAILRIACNYILSLAQLAELDYSPDHNSLSFSQCVEQCTRTLQAEGRSKKRKAGRLPEDV